MHKNVYRNKQYTGNRRRKIKYRPKKNSLIYKLAKKIADMRKKIKYRKVNHVLEGVKIHQKLEEQEKNI